MVNLQIQGEGGEKKVSFQQEMEVKTTEINSLILEMGKINIMLLMFRGTGSTRSSRFLHHLLVTWQV